MLVFVDESGDAGFKIAKGSSPIFVVAMVLFADNEMAARTQRVIVDLARKINVKPEFKFNKCKDEFRDAFFGAISTCRFETLAVVVRKEQIYSPALREVKESFLQILRENDDAA